MSGPLRMLPEMAEGVRLRAESLVHDNDCTIRGQAKELLRCLDEITLLTRERDAALKELSAATVVPSTGQPCRVVSTEDIARAISVAWQNGWDLAELLLKGNDQ